MTNLIGQIKDNYGSTPAFNSIIMSYYKEIGNSVIIQANNDIKSNKLTEKQLVNGVWQDNSEITMEIDGGEMSDFLFTLEEVDLNKVPAIVKEAKEKVSKEKDLAEVKVTTVSISMPSTVSDKLKDLTYTIVIEPKNGGTSFVLRYDLSGKFLDMTY